MKILVTGGLGFVGNFIAQQLKSEYEIITPSRENLDLLNLEQVEHWFKNNKVDFVIHCALTGREDLFSTNPIFLSDGLLMFRNLWLQKNNFDKLINLGTAYELNLEKNNWLIKEDEFINHIPKTSYGYSKNVIARIISTTKNFYNLRLFGVFHETESKKRFFQKVINEEKIIISNDQYLDYIYLQDIIPMIKCIIDGKAQHFDINMVYPHKYRLSELAYYLCKELNIDSNKVQVLGSNGLNLTGNSDRLSSYNFDLIGIKEGLRKYK